MDSLPNIKRYFYRFHFLLPIRLPLLGQTVQSEEQAQVRQLVPAPAGRHLRLLRPAHLHRHRDRVDRRPAYFRIFNQRNARLCLRSGDGRDDLHLHWRVHLPLRISLVSCTSHVSQGMSEEAAHATSSAAERSGHRLHSRRFALPCAQRAATKKPLADCQRLHADENCFQRNLRRLRHQVGNAVSPVRIGELAAVQVVEKIEEITRAVEPGEFPYLPAHNALIEVFFIEPDHLPVQRPLHYSC